MPQTPDLLVPPLDAVFFPADPDELKRMPPLVIQRQLHQAYRHSYGELSPYFAGLANGVLLGSRCPACGRRYATPRPVCGGCGAESEWFELPRQGRIHSYTVCCYSGETFRGEAPFALVLVEFDGVDTLLLSRLRDSPPEAIHIGLAVEARFARPSRLTVADLWFVPA